MTEEELLESVRRAVRTARELGADDAEVCAEHERERRVELRQGDIEGAASAEETLFGIRVLKGGAMGFATVNRIERLEDGVREAIRLAKVGVPDPELALSLQDERKPLPARPMDQGLERLDLKSLLDLGAALLRKIKDADARVRIDSGGVQTNRILRAIANSRGIAATDSHMLAGAHVFGMAVEGEDVGSFDVEGQWVHRLDSLEPEMSAAAERFVTKVTSALSAKPGKTFRGTVILCPEVVQSLVIANLTAQLSARAVRLKTTPLAGRIGDAISVPGFDLTDNPHKDHVAFARRFDREGITTGALPLLSDGCLRNYLYDVYEARHAGLRSTGHAQGSAQSTSSIGAHALELSAGETSFASLCGECDLGLVVTRFSGNCNPVTGEFSGVVKGGFLIERGVQRPVNETLIAGNLLTLLHDISGISSERRLLDGQHLLPGLRVESIAVTAGGDA